jgi:hypothetical protein
MMNNKFEYTSKGYIEARSWLQETGEWTNVEGKGFSCDGWSVIHEANSIWEKNNKDNGDKDNRIL